MGGMGRDGRGRGAEPFLEAGGDTRGHDPGSSPTGSGTRKHFLTQRASQWSYTQPPPGTGAMAGATSSLELPTPK